AQPEFQVSAAASISFLAVATMKRLWQRQARQAAEQRVRLRQLDRTERSSPAEQVQLAAALRQAFEPAARHLQFFVEGQQRRFSAAARPSSYTDRTRCRSCAAVLWKLLLLLRHQVQ